MIFETLKEKCDYYRNLGERHLIPNMPMLVMIDGRSFSKLVKNKFNKPFDDDFVSMMNDVAMTLVNQISGCQLAYVQSDEISLLITDINDKDPFFKWRQSKINSIIPSIASSRLTHLFAFYDIFRNFSVNDKVDSKNVLERLKMTPEVQFDCKSWNVPNLNEVFAWFLYRQNDCVRNSKQQTTQTYLPNKSLIGLNCDEQLNVLMKEKSIDWHSFDDNVKYGRLIFKSKQILKREDSDEEYERNKIELIPCPCWNEVGIEEFKKYIQEI